MDIKTLLKRLSNVGTIITLVSWIILLLTVNGITIDNYRIMTTVKIVCAIGTLLGILNNPDTPGIDLPGLSRGVSNDFNTRNTTSSSSENTNTDITNSNH